MYRYLVFPKDLFQDIHVKIFTYVHILFFFMLYTCIIHISYIYHICICWYISLRSTLQVLTPIHPGVPFPTCLTYEFSPLTWNDHVSSRKWTWWCQAAGIGPSVTGQQLFFSSRFPGVFVRWELQGFWRRFVLVLFVDVIGLYHLDLPKNLQQPPGSWHYNFSSIF